MIDCSCFCFAWWGILYSNIFAYDYRVDVSGIVRYGCSEFELKINGLEYFGGILREETISNVEDMIDGGL